MSSNKVRTRQPLNTRQRNILMEFYKKNPYPTAVERQGLVQLTGRTSKQVQDWFSNRRRNDPRLISSTNVPIPTQSTNSSSPPIQEVSGPSLYYENVNVQLSPSSSLCSCCCQCQSSNSSHYNYYPIESSYNYPVFDYVYPEVQY